MYHTHLPLEGGINRLHNGFQVHIHSAEVDCRPTCQRLLEINKKEDHPSAKNWPIGQWRDQHWRGDIKKSGSEEPGIKVEKPNVLH